MGRSNSLMLTKVAIIKKLPNGRYRLFSRKKDKSGKRRNLGTFDSLEDAKKREKQVQFFKYHAEDQNSRDKETKALSLLSDLASYLEQAGYIKHSQDLYNVMDAIDSNLDNADDGIPDAQRNVENMGTLGDTGISSGFFGAQEAEKLASLANRLDKLGLFSEADQIDNVLFCLATNPEAEIVNAVKAIKRDYKDGKFDNLSSAQDIMYMLADRLHMNLNNRQEGGFIAGLAAAMDFIHPQEAFGDPNYYQSALAVFNNPDSALEGIMEESAEEMDNVDMLAKLNGLQGNTVTDNQNSGMFQGLSDSYFYTDYTNLDHRYKIAP